MFDYSFTYMDRTVYKNFYIFKTSNVQSDSYLMY